MARQKKPVFANRTCVVSWSKGLTRVIKGDAWTADAALVKERPDLFDKQMPEKAIRGRVERATNRPGERRGTPPPVDTPPPADPPADPAENSEESKSDDPDAGETTAADESGSEEESDDAGDGAEVEPEAELAGAK